jgi:protein-tyrosine phosphatase
MSSEVSSVIPPTTEPRIPTRNRFSPCSKLREFLYLGDRHGAGSLEVLQTNKITCIVNVADDVPNSFSTERAFTYLNLNVHDGFSSNLASKLNSQLFKRINHIIDVEHGVIFVHCKNGVNRSAALCCAILMQREGLRFSEAERDVLTKREVSILSVNKDVLKTLERSLFFHRQRLKLRKAWLKRSSQQH